MAVKKILQAELTGGDEKSDSFLHLPAKKVNVFTDETKQIIQDLRDTLFAYPFCVGISAPQIGYPYMISVINIKRESRDDDFVLINPQIISLTGKKDKKRESCMSLWGKLGEVIRREKLIIEYNDEIMEVHQYETSGFESRVIQHEIDHLNGVLYSERLIEGAELSHADFFDEFEILEG